MPHPSKSCAFLFKKRREGSPPALWEIAEPVSLDEIREQLAVLTRGHVQEHHPHVEHEALSLEQLWDIFEKLQDIDDCQVVL